MRSSITFQVLAPILPSPTSFCKFWPQWLKPTAGVQDRFQTQVGDWAQTRRGSVWIPHQDKRQDHQVHYLGRDHRILEWAEKVVINGISKSPEG